MEEQINNQNIIKTYYIDHNREIKMMITNDKLDLDVKVVLFIHLLKLGRRLSLFF